MGSPGCPLAYTGPSCSSHASSSFSLPSLVFLLSLNPTEGMEATEEDTGAMEDTVAKDLLKLNPQLNPLLNLLLTHTMEDMAMEDMEDMEDTMEDTVVMVVMAMGVMAKDPLSLLQQPLLLLILTTDMVDTMEATEAMVVMAMGATGVKHSRCENFGLAWT